MMQECNGAPMPCKDVVRLIPEEQRSRYEAMSKTISSKNRRILAGIYGAALLYFVLKQVYFALCVGFSPDYPAHLSYIIWMCRHPSVFPDYASLPLYRVSDLEGMALLMVPEPGKINYLGHPSLYYLLMSLTGPVRFLEDGTACVDYLKICLCNTALVSVAAVLAFRLGYRRLKSRSPVVHLLFAAAVVTLPELGYVGAGANNDNLAFLAFALFFTGVIRYQEDRTNFGTYTLIGIGFLLGSFAKLTTALIMLVMLAAILALSVIRTRSVSLVTNKNFLVVLPCLLLFLAYEIAVFCRYGAFQPSLASFAPEYFRTTDFWISPENREVLTFWQYFRRFLGGIGYSWSSLYGHDRAVNNLMNNRHFGLVYWIPVFASMIAAAVQCIRKKADRYTIPAVLAFLLTLSWHLYTGWSGFLRNGYTGGTQGRYYLPLIIPFALIFTESIPFFRTKKAKAVFTVFALILTALWLAGDAPRLLLARGFPVLT